MPFGAGSATDQGARHVAEGLNRIFGVPAVVAAYHFGYGIGSLIGGWDALRHGHGSARFAGLTR